MTHAQRRHQAFALLPRQDRHVLRRRQEAEDAARRAAALLNWTDGSPAGG